MDIPKYDALWGAEAELEYLYISWRYQNREDFVTSQFKDDPLLNIIVSLIPRLAMDYPYIKCHKAQTLHFTARKIKKQFGDYLGRKLDAENQSQKPFQFNWKVPENAKKLSDSYDQVKKKVIIIEQQRKIAKDSIK